VSCICTPGRRATALRPPHELTLPRAASAFPLPCRASRLGDPCSFRLVVKNATTLTNDAGLVAETYEEMESILRQLQLLDDKLDMAIEGDEGAAAAVPELLRQAVAANVAFERSISTCLGLDS